MAEKALLYKATIDENVSSGLNTIAKSTAVATAATKGYSSALKQASEAQGILFGSSQYFSAETMKQSASIDNAKKSATGAQGAFSNLGKAAMAAGAGFVALEAAKKVTAFLTSAYEEAKKADVAQQKLSAALGFTSAALKEQAEALKFKSRYDDDDITAMQARLAPYAKSESAIKAMTPAILDMAEATGQDLGSAAVQVAKAFADDAGELGRYKIKIDGAAGSQARMASITAGLTEKFGGQAKAAHDAAGGAGDLQKSIGDTVKSIGYYVAPIVDFWVPKIASVFDAVRKGMEWINNAENDPLKNMDDAKLQKYIADKKELEQQEIRYQKGATDFSRSLRNQATLAQLELDYRKKIADEAEKAKNAPAGADLGAGSKTDAEIEKAKKLADEIRKQRSDDAANDAKILQAQIDSKMGLIQTAADEECEIEKNKNEAILSFDKEYEAIRKENGDRIRAENKKNAEIAAKAEIEQKAQVAKSYWDSAELGLRATAAVLKESKASAKAQKAIAIGQIAMDTARASMAMWASTATLPWPANIIVGAVQQAALIGLAAANIAMVAKQKFAQGGIVQGPSSGDTVNIRANGGEAVLTQSQQANLLQMANGKGNGGGTSITISPVVRVDSGMTAGERDRTLRAAAESTRDALIQLVATNRMPALR